MTDATAATPAPKTLPPDDVLREEIITIFVSEGMVERDKLDPNASFQSLGLESLDVVMLLMGIEEKYGIYLPIDGELSGVGTLSELLDLLVARIKTAEPAAAALSPAAAGNPQ